MPLPQTLRIWVRKYAVRVRENSGVELEWEIKRIGVAESLAKP